MPPINKPERRCPTPELCAEVGACARLEISGEACAEQPKVGSEGKAWLEVCPGCFYAQAATLMEQPPLCPEVKRKHQGIPPRMVRVVPASDDSPAPGVSSGA